MEQLEVLRRGYRVWRAAGDFLLFAGDAGIPARAHAVAFNEWLASQDHRYKVVTFGNMDFWAESSAFRPEVLAAADAVLMGDIRRVGGFRIFGSPFTPEFYGSFQLESEDAAAAYWGTVLPPDADVDILITHGPPYGHGDVTKGRHVGDAQLLHAVQQLRKLWVVGHIHESHGIHSVPHPSGADIILVNAATDYVRFGKESAQPLVVELPTGNVSQPTADV